jgi:hypothetical protein
VAERGAIRVQTLDALGLLGALRGVEARVHLDPYVTSTWFDTFLGTCLDREDRVASAMVRDGERSLVLPMRVSPTKWKLLSYLRLRSLTNFYSCRFDVATNAAIDSAMVEHWARDMRAGRPRPAEIMFECLDPHAASFAALRAGLQGAGYWVAPFFMFLTRFSDLRPWRAAGGFPAYWQARPSALRNTVDRKAKQAEKNGYSILVSRPGDDAALFIGEYEKVHAASWKPPEPYPNFMPTLIGRGVADGSIVVALLRKGEETAAAQVWLIGDGKATIFKLSYREEAKALSAGSILSREMMRRAFVNEGVDIVDFGWGDDEYKKDWLPDAAERWGLAAYDPATPVGFALGLRNVAVKRLLGRLREPV